MKLFTGLLKKKKLKSNMQENGFKIGDVVEVEVAKIQNFGAIVKLPGNKRGLIHISQVSDDFVKDINEYLKVGEKIKACVKKISFDGKIDLTLKKKKKPAAPVKREKEFKFCHLEEKMDEFLKRKESSTA